MRRRKYEHGNEMVSGASGARDLSDISAPSKRGWARNNRVRHFSWCPRGHRDTCYHDIPPSSAGALERYRRRHQRTVESPVCTGNSCTGNNKSFIHGENGQATVEFALVVTAFLIIVVVLALLWHQIQDGLFVEHALAAASHHVGLAMPGSIADVFLY